MKHIINIYLALAVVMVTTTPACASNYFKGNYFNNAEPAATYRVDPTYPGLNVRDRTQPSIIIEQYEDGTEMGYETMPGLNVRDYSKPGYMIERIK